MNPSPSSRYVKSIVTLLLLRVSITRIYHINLRNWNYRLFIAVEKVQSCQNHFVGKIKRTEFPAFRYRRSSRPCITPGKDRLAGVTLDGLGTNIGAVTICMEFRSDPSKSFPCKSVSNAVRHREDSLSKSSGSGSEERKREAFGMEEMEKPIVEGGSSYSTVLRAEMIRRIIVPFA